MTTDVEHRLLAAIEHEAEQLEELDFAHYVVDCCTRDGDSETLEHAAESLRKVTEQLRRSTLMRSLVSADAAAAYGLDSAEPSLAELAATAPMAVANRIRDLREQMAEAVARIEGRSAASGDDGSRLTEVPPATSSTI